MELNKSDNLSFALNCLWHWGLDPTRKSWRDRVFRFLLYPLLCGLELMVFAKLAFVNGSTNEISEVFESLSTFFQILVRETNLMLYAGLMKEIADYCKHYFWDPYCCGPALGDTLRKQSGYPVVILKVLLGTGFVTIMLLCASTKFVENKSLPEACWIPGDNKILEAIVYGVEVLVLIKVLFILGGFDGFFLIMCTELNVQFTLLVKVVKSVDFENVDEKTCWEKLRKCATHHKHLLLVKHKLNEAFSVFLVLQYLMNVALTCIQLYIIKDESATTEQVAKGIFYFFCLFLQTALFYVPATSLSAKAEEFAIAIYDLNWHATNKPQIRRHVLFMLMKAQEPMKISGGKLFAIDMKQFIEIFKISFTISTLLER